MLYTSRRRRVVRICNFISSFFSQFFAFSLTLRMYLARFIFLLFLKYNLKARNHHQYFSLFRRRARFIMAVVLRRRVYPKFLPAELHFSLFLYV